MTESELVAIIKTRKCNWLSMKLCENESIARITIETDTSYLCALHLQHAMDLMEDRYWPAFVLECVGAYRD